MRSHLALCRFYSISPLDLERLPAWLLEEMHDYAVMVQAEEKRASRRRHG